MITVRKASGKKGSYWIADIGYRDSQGRLVRTRRRCPLKTKDEALAWANEQHQQLSLGVAAVPVNSRCAPEPLPQLAAAPHVSPTAQGESDGDNPTLLEFAERFLAYCASPSATKKGANSLGELQEKRRALTQHLIPAFGTVRLRDFRPKHFDAYVVTKVAEPFNLSHSTVANHLIVMRRLLAIAQRWELIDRIPHIAIPPKNRKAEFLQPEELERMLAVAGEWKLFLLLAARAGLRVGELITLEWRDISLDPPRVVVQRAWSRGIVKLPKSGKPRRVPLAPSVVEALQPLCPKLKTSARVFLTAEGTRLTHSIIRGAVRRIALAAGVRRHVNPHMLRHTFGTHASASDVPLRTVQDWMGHADIKTTMGYAHAAPTLTDHLIDRVDKLESKDKTLQVRSV